MKDRVLREIAGRVTVMGKVPLLYTVLFLFSTMAAQAAERQVLKGHVPQAVTSLNLQPLRQVPATSVLHLAIGLPLRDPDAAKAFVQQLYDPASPLYHQYLTPEQFTEKFSLSVDDYQAVIDFARANGFTVTGTYPNRLMVNVDAGAADVERTFQVKLLEYQHPTEARTFYAPDVEPSVPAGVKILDVSGLTSFPSPHPNSHVGGSTGQASTPNPNGGSINNGAYIGKDFRAAYVPGSTLTGTGQSVALVQFDNYYARDITNYVNLAGLSFVTLTNIFLDSYTGTIGSGNGEVSLDIEMVISMAPGVSRIYLYEGNPASGYFKPNDVLQRIANDNNSKQISCSWGWTGGPSGTTDNIFIQMASQGQSFFVASGDSDAYPGSTVDSSSGYGTPVASAYVTSVGGTTLSTLGPTNNWTSETVWNWYVEYYPYNNGVGSSGGYSVYYSIPTWQQGVNSANLGSTTGRNFPDVALTGDHVFVAYGNGKTNWFGGTSCAAPLWAGFTALVNQQCAANGKSPVGFLNPAIYAIGTGTTYTACFHDTTTGNNEWSKSPSAYTALTGYDLCTGWGTPTGTNLINALVGPPISASCSFTSNPTNAVYPAAGGSSTVAVTASSNNCSWTASSSNGFITITSATNGTGNGSISYSVAPNSAQGTRIGTLAIAGQTVTVTEAGGYDSIGDGIPDWWRAQYFGGGTNNSSGNTTNSQSCAACDPDGDGMNNLQEYLTGTDPTNSASSFQITSVATSGNDVLINWMTGTGKTNAVQAAPGTGDGSYDTNNFADIFTVTNTVGLLTNYLDVGAATNVPPRFYRVRLVP